MDNINDILISSKKINKMYKNVTYFDEYGGSVLLFILLTILLFIGHSYSVIMMNIKPIQDNWPAQRCNPRVIPFAGFINKPANMSVGDYTNENFQYCVQNILVTITGFAVQPITYATMLLQNVYSELSQAMDFMNSMMANIRTNLSAMGENTMNRIANVLVPLQRILIVIKDFMEKIKGIFTASLYTSLGTYYALQGLMGAIGQLLIIILIILSVLIIGFWIIPFTWPFAITMTSIFVSVSIPLAIMLVFMTEVLQVNIDLKMPQVPSKPNMCFDKDTFIKMNDGTVKKIIDICVGDVLVENNFVTAKLTLDASNTNMYRLHDIIVSGCHPVKYNDDWITVSKHPKAIQLINYIEPYIYCINTSKKVINIKDTVFSDWDEIYDKEAISLKNVVKENYGDMYDDSIDEKGWIHHYLDEGFAASTLVTLKNGEKREIKDIRISDVLKNGEIVTGLVEIDGKQLRCQNKYHLGNCVIDGGPNLQFNNNVSFSKLNKKEYFRETIVKKDRLYHILTDTETFTIEDIKFYHYNSTLERFLE